jgi:sn-glycerol 3-phosphate transport system ATP-binding protein
MNVVAGSTLAQASPHWSKALGGRAGEIAVGIRPEDIHLADDGVDAEVASIEYLGADSVMTCMVGDQIVAVRAKGKLSGGGGDRVRLAWDTSAMHCFDRAAGHRLTERIV